MVSPLFRPQRKFAYLFTFLITLCSCSHNQQVEDFLTASTAKLAKYQPFEANSQMSILLPDQLDSLEFQVEQQQLIIDSVRHLRLSESILQELEDLETQLAKERLRIQQARSNPAIYNLGGLLKRVLVNQEYPLWVRLTQIDSCLQYAESYYDSAKQILQQPTPEKLPVAIQKQLLGIQFLLEELPDSIQKADPITIDSLLPQFQQQIEQGKIGIKDYLAYCQSLYLDSVQLQSIVED